LQANIAAEMNRIVDEYVEVTAFSALLKSFIAVKAAENTRWSDITLYVHYMFAGNSPNIDRLAALTEMMILALDIMDDLQDQDHTDMPWMTSPQGHALNAVVALLMTVIGEAARLEGVRGEGIPPFVHEVSRILMKALDGQYRDLGDSIVTEADYMVMIQEKSGSLIRLACYMGYGSSSILTKDIETMNELAYCIGAIAQIENDIKDVLGFDLKNDLLQKKRTLPILFLLFEPDEDFPIIQQFYAGKLTQQQFLTRKKECIQYIIDSGCIEYAKVIQQLLINKAECLLNSVEGISPWKEKFADVTLKSS
jgi:competence protein ComQ